MASTPGFDLQRSQDTSRPARRGFRVPRDAYTPISQRQTANQTQQGGRATDPETAHHRDENPARGSYSRGDHPTQPHHPGLVSLLPERGVQKDVRPFGHPHVETDP